LIAPAGPFAASFEYTDERRHRSRIVAVDAPTRFAAAIRGLFDVPS
jgi:hypothetical protein